MAEQADAQDLKSCGSDTVPVRFQMCIRDRSMAIGTSLIPIIAESFILNKKKSMESKINMSMKLSTVIAFPSTLGLFFLAEPIMKLIFFKNYQGIEILRYLSLSIPFIIITQTSTSVLQASNHYIRPVINLFIGCLVKVLLLSLIHI